MAFSVADRVTRVDGCSGATGGGGNFFGNDLGLAVKGRATDVRGENLIGAPLENFSPSLIS